MNQEKRNESGVSPTITIGSDLVVNRIGYGAMQLTGPKVWGDYPDREGGIALLREVVASGVNFIDTADTYGPFSSATLIYGGVQPCSDALVVATRGRFVVR